MNYSTLPCAKIQIAPAPDASTVNDFAAVNFMPKGNVNWSDVLAAMAMGPINAVSTDPGTDSPSPMVTLMAFAPLLIVKWSTMMDTPAAGAAFNSSQPETSALTPFKIKPDLADCGVVTVMAIALSSFVKLGGE